MRTAAGILMIIGGLFLFTVMRAALGHGSWLGTLLMIGLVAGGIVILRRKQKKH